ncbi:class II glutamine amidotransferase [Planctomycetota bacterium]
MCRIFGFKATDSTNIRFSLAHAENALRVQSVTNPDGWGVGFYVNNDAKVIKRPISADSDYAFLQLSDIVSSDCVLAHVRKGSVGAVNTVNCHPFNYQQWLFAHNGTLEEAGNIQAKLAQTLAPQLKNNILGSTDSEMCFHVILNILLQEFAVDLDNPDLSSRLVCTAVAAAICHMDNLSRKAGADYISRFNFVLTNGTFMLATRRGSDMYYLERYRQPDAVGMWANAEQREGLDILLEEDADSAPRASVFVASEPITAEKWQEMPQDSCLIIDNQAKVDIFPMKTLDAEEISTLESYIDMRMREAGLRPQRPEEN